LWFEVTDSLLTGGYHIRRQIQEQPVFYNPGALIQLRPYFVRIGNGTKVAVQKLIALVGSEGISIFALTNLHLSDSTKSTARSAACRLSSTMSILFVLSITHWR
jgi:hypothetical protein